MVGYKADGDLTFLKKEQKRNLEFIAINNQLKRTALSPLSLKLIKKTPVSSLVKQNNGTFSYQTVIKEELVHEDVFNITKEGSRYSIDTQQIGTFDLLLMNDQLQVVSRLEYKVVGEGNLLQAHEHNAELNVSLNKFDYKAGEDIELNIVSPYHGAGLITIESSKVHAFKWFQTDQTNTLQSIKVPENLEGNAYINVTFLRSIESKEIYTSPLSYAVVPFNIDKSSRNISIDLNVAKVSRPGKPLKIEYKTNKPAKVLVYAVDEGILQVAQYQTPDPLNYFFSKKALSVSTSQMLDLLLPEYKFFKQLSGVGGGMSAELLAANLNPFVRKRDKPAIFWSGILESHGDDEYQHVEFDVPDTFGGSLRVIAVAVNEQAIGAQEEQVLVKGPFVLTPQVLSVTTPGDLFDVSIGIANLIDGSGNDAPIELEIEVPEQLKIIDTDPTEGKYTVNLKIDENSESLVDFKVKVLDYVGEASIKFTARHQSIPKDAYT